MNAPQIIRLDELINLVGLSRSTIYEKMNPESKYHDATFPKSRTLGKRSVGWNKPDVLRWIESTALYSRKPVDIGHSPPQ